MSEDFRGASWVQGLCRGGQIVLVKGSEGLIDDREMVAAPI